MTRSQAYFTRKRRAARRAVHAAFSIFLTLLVILVLAPAVAGVAYQLIKP